MFRRILKEPLFLFFGLGALLFVLHSVVAPNDGGDDRRIVVDRAALLTFMQYRAKAFDPERFDEILVALPDAEVKALVADYAREEALYREAKALDLDRNDYLARRRLVQQLEFITRGFISADAKLSDQELATWYQANRANYAEPAKITFAHVFFNAETWGEARAEQRARGELVQLNRQAVPFHAAMGHGDRFLYHVNYVAKEPEEIESHFGSETQRALFALTADDRVWRGPYRSPHGFHLVMVTHQTPARTPELAHVREKVAEDATQARKETAFEKALASIVDTYEVEIADDLKRGSKAGS